MKNFNTTILNTSHNRGVRKALMTSALISLFAITAPAYAQSSKTFDVEGFNAIKAEAGVNVVYVKSETYKVQANLESGTDDTLRVKKRGDTLYLARKTKNGWADGSTRVTVNVAGPELDFIEASSGAKVMATDIDAERLKIRTASGGRVVASGTCGSLSTQADSGGMANLSKVICNQVVAKAYSGGGLKVYADKTIKTRTDSGGSIRVFGSPSKRNVKSANGPYGGRTSFAPKE